MSIASSDTNLCRSQNTILTATGSPSGGSYQWSPVTGMTPVAGNTSSVTVAPSSTQAYQVVYALNGCSGSAFKTVNVYPRVTAHAGGNQTYCLPVGSTITLGGSPTATGGSGRYAYTWSPSTNLSGTAVANPTITTAVAGTTKYYLTVTDSTTLCTSVDSMVLTLNQAASASIASSDTNLCSGQNTILTATGAPSGGSYQWSPVTAMTPVAGNTASVTVAPSSTQAYQVVYTLNGCTGTAAKTVNIYPGVTAHAGGNQTYCLPVGSTITLGSSPSATGGSGRYAYTWSPSTNLNGTAVANPTITTVAAGTTKYYLTVTDSTTLCTSVDSMVLTINPTATVSIASSDTNLCRGQNTVLTATGAPSGGSYQWSPVTAMTPVAGNTASVTVAPSSTQAYQVVYTLNGCNGTASKTVNVYRGVVAHAGGNQTYCMPVGSTITLGSSPAATGGSGRFAYSWSPSTNLSGTTVANPTITTVVAGTIKYYLTVTDSTTLCTSVDSMVLTLYPSASVSIASSDTNLCSGQSTILAATGSPSGGSYLWNPTIGMTPVAGNVASVTVSPSGTQAYQVIYTLNGCSSSASKTVNICLLYTSPSPRD